MNIAFSINEDGIANLLFDFQNEKINKLDAKTLFELQDHLNAVRDNQHIKLLTFSSAKPGIFIAGADINEIQSISTQQEAKQKAQVGQHIIHQISQLPFPTLAIINGACVGGGCELALACDFRIISDEKKARIGLPEVKLGIIPGFGGCVRLPRLIGLQGALQLILTGQLINAKKALRLKLVDAIYNHSLGDEFMRQFCTKLCDTPEFKQQLLAQRNKSLSAKLLEDNPVGRKLIFGQAKQKLLKKSHGHYPAPLMALSTIEKTCNMPVEDALATELEGFSEVAVTPISKHLIALFFTTEALKKTYTSEDVHSKPIHHSAVIGAGVMGGGIAWLLSQHHKPVRLKDIQWPALAKGLQTAAGYYQQLKTRRKIKAKQINYKMSHISPSVNYHGFTQVTFAIEAVVEKMDIKKTILAEVERQLPTDAILASNTSSLSITEMASALQRPEQMVGIHFFNPVNRMPLVEVIPGAQTSEQTIARSVALVRSLGKTPIVVGDCPGFLVNRILIPMLNEAALILQEGGEVCEIDYAIKKFGLPMGPFVLADEVGIDIGYHVATTLEQAYGERMKVAGIFTHLFVKEQLLGKKSGKGFYIHHKKSRPTYNKALDTMLTFYRFKENIEVQSFSPEQIVQRCMLIMVNEAARCLEEGIIDEPAFLDMAMLMGTGFPPFRGGLLKYADQQGLKRVCSQLDELSARYGTRFTPAQLIRDKASQGHTFYGGVTDE